MSKSKRSGRSSERYGEALKGGTDEFYPGHGKDKVLSIAWNIVGDHLASGGADRSIHIWNFSKSGLKQEVILQGHESSVDQVRWAPNKPNLLASASADKSIGIWDTRAGKQAQNIDTPGENINVSWSPSGSLIACGNKKDTVSLIDVRKGAIMHNRQFPYEVNEMSWCQRNGREYLFLTSASKKRGTVLVQQLDRSTGKLKDLHSFPAHSMNCYCIDFDATGAYFVIGGADALVSVWSLDELVCMRTLDRLQYPVRTVCFNHDSQLIASAAEDNFIDISSVATGAQVHKLALSPKKRTTINQLRWHPRELVLAFAGEELDRRNLESGLHLYTTSSRSSSSRK